MIPLLLLTLAATIERPDPPQRLPHTFVIGDSTASNGPERTFRTAPDEKWVIFRSNMLGPTYTFAVDVEKAK